MWETFDKTYLSDQLLRQLECLLRWIGLSRASHNYLCISKNTQLQEIQFMMKPTIYPSDHTLSLHTAHTRISDAQRNINNHYKIIWPNLINTNRTRINLKKFEENSGICVKSCESHLCSFKWGMAVALECWLSRASPDEYYMVEQVIRT